MFWQIVAFIFTGLAFLFIGIIVGVYLSALANLPEKEEKNLEIGKLKLEILHLQNELWEVADEQNEVEQEECCEGGTRTHLSDLREGRY